MTAVGMVGDALDFDPLAWQRIGHIDGLPVDKRDTVATTTDVIDGQDVNHGARPERTRGCHRHRESLTEKP